MDQRASSCSTATRSSRSSGGGRLRSQSTYATIPTRRGDGEGAAIEHWRLRHEAETGHASTDSLCRAGVLRLRASQPLLRRVQEHRDRGASRTDRIQEPAQLHRFRSHCSAPIAATSRRPSCGRRNTTADSCDVGLKRTRRASRPWLWLDIVQPICEVDRCTGYGFQLTLRS